MPIINPLGVLAGIISAGTTKATLGEVVFSNSNNVSFGVSGQTVTASAAGGGGGNTGSISAGTTRATLGEVVFSNSNGLSFGVNGQTVTGSYTVPATAGLISHINVSGGTTSNNLTNVVFSNSNNVSFGLNGSTITASINTSLTNIRVSAGTTSNLLSAVTFSNANGISFGLDASTITASVNTSLTNIRVSAGTTSNLLSAITFSNSNGISFGLDASTITASYTVPTVTNSSWTVSDNATSGTVARLAFTNLNNVTLSLSTGAGGSHTIVGSINTSLTNIRVSAGTTSNLLSAITFSNANGVSFGLDASTITASINTSLTNIRVSAGTTSNLLSAITFSNANNVSFGLDASTITASVNTSLTNIRVSAGTTSNLLSAMTFSDANNVSFGINASTITASVNTSLTNIRVSAGTTSNLLSAITFSNANGISFGLNASTITASYTVPGTLSVYAVSNTTQSTSGTIPFSSLQFNGAGIASVGVSNGSVIVSVPAGGGAGDGGVFAGVSDLGNTAGSTGTVSTGNFVLVGSNGISLSQSTGAAGSQATVTIYDALLTRYQNASAITAGGANIASGSFSLFPIVLQRNVSAGRVRFAMSVSAATQTNTSSAGLAITCTGKIYRLTGSTLTRVNEFSTTITAFARSNSTESIAGVRIISVPLLTTSIFTPGDYWVGVQMVSATSFQTSLGRTISMAVIPTWASGFSDAGLFGTVVANTGVVPFFALANTTAFNNTLVTNDVGVQSVSIANLWFEMNSSVNLV